MRVVHHGDGIAFLATKLPADHAIVTSLPDHSELPALGPNMERGGPAPTRGPTMERGGPAPTRGPNMERGGPAPTRGPNMERGGPAPTRGIDGWRAWFVDTVALVCRAVADEAVAMFYQTDVKYDGRWIDKGHLVMTGADAAGSHVLWHKIVCRVPPGTTTFGRPAYAHCICTSRARRLLPGASTPDVLPSLGEMSWSRAMGSAACEMAVTFAKSIGATTIVDPFCGLGSVLAAANAQGLAAIGVEISRRRAAKARQL